MNTKMVQIEHVKRTPHGTPATENAVEQGSSSSVLGRSPSQRTAINANHLLNFQSYSGRGRQGGPHRPHHRRGPRPPPYDKNKFLQANFRFVVSDAIDMNKYSANADVMLNWDDVLQVEILVDHPLTCPIVLDTPLCPQITPCGHVFSFPAIMQHLINIGGVQLRKAAPCPLCFNLIAARELRLVHMHTVTPVKGTQDISWQLIKRPKGSIMAHPVAQRPPYKQSPVKPTTGGHDTLGKVPPAWIKEHHKGDAPVKDHQGGRDEAEAMGEAGIRSAFTKFATVADATPFWREAAEQLAEYAVQLTTEGGTDAALEAPHVYAAMDALQRRAQSWAERRQAMMLRQAGPVSASHMMTTEKAGELAAEAVKQVTNAAVHAAHVNKQEQAAAQQLNSNFPTLPQVHGAISPQPSAALAPMTSGPFVDPFSSEDEDEGPCGHHGDEEEDMTGTSPVHQPSPPNSSPLMSTTTHASGAVAQGTSPVESGSFMPPKCDSHFYYYQCSDGQWVFLHPVTMRCLLYHYKSYEDLPATFTAPSMQAEELVMNEATRKKLKFLGHLPTNGCFQLYDADLSNVLPADVLAVFSDELAARTQRRKDKAAAAAKKAQKEAAAAAAAEAAMKGPSVQELRAMPLPSATRAVSFVAADKEDFEDDWQPLAPPPVSTGSPSNTGTTSFAHITKMGFAATGPTLNLSNRDPAPSSGVAVPGTSGTAGVAPISGAWANRLGKSPPATAPIHQLPTTPAPSAPIPANPWMQPLGGPKGGPMGAHPGGASGPTAAPRGVHTDVEIRMAQATTPLVARSLAGGAASGDGRKAKKGGKQVLMCSASQRKY